MKKNLPFFLFVVLLNFFLPRSVYAADCQNPEGYEGQVICCKNYCGYSVCSSSNCPTNPKSLTCHDGSWGSPVSDAPGCRIGCGTYMAALGYLSDCGGTVPFCTYYPTVKKCTKRVIQIGPVKTSDCGNCYGYTASDTFGCNYGCNSSCECSSAGEPTPTPGGPTTAPTNPPPVVPPTIPPASGFTASDGDYSNKVYLDWSPVVGAGGYGVYRRGADRRNRWLDAFRQSLPSNNSVL